MDYKGLDLSLGLPCGGSSSNSADTDERTSKILNDFKIFLNGNGKPQDNSAMDEGSTADNEEVAESQAEGSTSTDSSTEKERPNTFASEYPAIKPGIAAEVKFGGSGSFPNLPWVSTTGPNGRTISGVTYKFNATQIKIVCACHGTHLTTGEFIRHASEEDPASQRAAPVPTSSPEASTKSKPESRV